MENNMGARDSSKTRVTPVFDILYSRDKTGISWLPKLLSLPTNGNIVHINPNWRFNIQDKGWGDEEKKLEPPVSLLSWLIRHPRMPGDGQFSKDPRKAQKRKELIQGSDIELHEALTLLRNNPSREDWHIFEGSTQPDVFIQTPDLVIVIEGKRTEPGATKDTKWMSGRHQIWRHIDCAWEVRGNREVFGFFIVEGLGPSSEVPEKWKCEALATMSEQALASSLPHRGPEEREEMHKCFLGVTTWQRVCTEFEIDWSLLPDVIG